MTRYVSKRTRRKSPAPASPRFVPPSFLGIAVQRGIVRVKTRLEPSEADVQQCTTIAVSQVQRYGMESRFQIALQEPFFASSNLFWLAALMTCIQSSWRGEICSGYRG
jgi:hypothetical protein